MRFSTTATMLAAGVALALAGCNSDGSSSGSGTGTLNLAVTDAPVDSAEHVYVTFSAVELKPKSGPPFTIELDEPVKIDLLALEGELSESLLDENTGDPVVPAGDYNWMRLHPQLDHAHDNAPQHTYIVVTENGAPVPYPLGIPSGEQTGLKLVSGFTVEEDQTAYYVIDFDLRRAVVQSGSEYKLRPAHRLVRVDNVGAIAGSVDGTLVSTHCELDGGQDAEGLAMYLFDGMDAEPHDANIHDAEKEASLVSTARVRWNDEDGAYGYGFGFLPPADYTLGLTCEGDLDDPETDDGIHFIATENATVSVGETTVVDFLAADAPEGGDNDEAEQDAAEDDDANGDDPEGDEVETQTI